MLFSFLPFDFSGKETHACKSRLLSPGGNWSTWEHMQHPVSLGVTFPQFLGWASLVVPHALHNLWTEALTISQNCTIFWDEAQCWAALRNFQREGCLAVLHISGAQQVSQMDFVVSRGKASSPLELHNFLDEHHNQKMTKFQNVSLWVGSKQVDKHRLVSH